MPRVAVVVLCALMLLPALQCREMRPMQQGNDVGAQTALYQAGDGGDSDRGGTTAAADGPCGLHKRGVGWGLTVAEIGALNGLTWYYNW